MKGQASETQSKEEPAKGALKKPKEGKGKKHKKEDKTKESLPKPDAPASSDSEKQKKKHRKKKEPKEASVLKPPSKRKGMPPELLAILGGEPTGKLLKGGEYREAPALGDEALASKEKPGRIAGAKRPSTSAAPDIGKKTAPAVEQPDETPTATALARKVPPRTVQQPVGATVDTTRPPSQPVPLPTDSVPPVPPTAGRRPEAPAPTGAAPTVARVPIRKLDAASQSTPPSMAEFTQTETPFPTQAAPKPMSDISTKKLQPLGLTEEESVNQAWETVIAKGKVPPSTATVYIQVKVETKHEDAAKVTAVTEPGVPGSTEILPGTAASGAAAKQATMSAPTTAPGQQEPFISPLARDLTQGKESSLSFTRPEEETSRPPSEVASSEGKVSSSGEAETHSTDARPQRRAEDLQSEISLRVEDPLDPYGKPAITTDSFVSAASRRIRWAAAMADNLRIAAKAVQQVEFAKQDEQLHRDRFATELLRRAAQASKEARVASVALASAKAQDADSVGKADSRQKRSNGSTAERESAMEMDATTGIISYTSSEEASKGRSRRWQEGVSSSTIDFPLDQEPNRGMPNSLKRSKRMKHRTEKFGFGTSERELYMSSEAHSPPKSRTQDVEVQTEKVRKTSREAFTACQTCGCLIVKRPPSKTVAERPSIGNGTASGAKSLCKRCFRLRYTTPPVTASKERYSPGSSAPAATEAVVHVGTAGFDAAAMSTRGKAQKSAGAQGSTRDFKFFTSVDHGGTYMPTSRHATVAGEDNITYDPKYVAAYEALDSGPPYSAPAIPLAEVSLLPTVPEPHPIWPFGQFGRVTRPESPLGGLVPPTPLNPVAGQEGPLPQGAFSNAVPQEMKGFTSPKGVTFNMSGPKQPSAGFAAPSADPGINMLGNITPEPTFVTTAHPDVPRGQQQLQMPPPVRGVRKVRKDYEAFWGMANNDVVLYPELSVVCGLGVVSALWVVFLLVSTSIRHDSLKLFRTTAGRKVVPGAHTSQGTYVTYILGTTPLSYDYSDYETGNGTAVPETTTVSVAFEASTTQAKTPTASSTGTDEVTHSVFICKTEFCIREADYLRSLLNGNPCHDFYDYVCRRLNAGRHGGAGVMVSTDTMLAEDLEDMALAHITTYANADVRRAREMLEECRSSRPADHNGDIRDIVLFYAPTNVWPLEETVSEDAPWRMAGRMLKDLNIRALLGASLEHSPYVPSDLILAIDPPYQLHRFSGTYAIRNRIVQAAEHSIPIVNPSADAKAAAEDVGEVAQIIARSVSQSAAPGYTRSNVPPYVLHGESYFLPLAELNYSAVKTMLQIVFPSTLPSTILVTSAGFLTFIVDAVMGNPAAFVHYLGFWLLLYFAPYLGIPALTEIFPLTLKTPPADSDRFCSRLVERVMPLSYMRALAAEMSQLALTRMWAMQVENRLLRALPRLKWLYQAGDTVDAHLAKYRMRQIRIAHFFPYRATHDASWDRYERDLSKVLAKASGPLNRVKAAAQMWLQEKNIGSIFSMQATYSRWRKLLYVPVGIVNASMPANSTLFVFHVARYGVRIYRSLLAALRAGDTGELAFSTDYEERLNSSYQCLKRDYRYMPVDFRQDTTKQPQGNHLLEQTVAVTLAYNTFQELLDTHRIWGTDFKLYGLEGLSSEQMFFVYFALDNCKRSRYEVLEEEQPLAASVRVNLPLRQSEQFSRAFGCDWGEQMKATEYCPLLNP